MTCHPEQLLALVSCHLPVLPLSGACFTTHLTHPSKYPLRGWMGRRGGAGGGGLNESTIIAQHIQNAKLHKTKPGKQVLLSINLYSQVLVCFLRLWMCHNYLGGAPSKGPISSCACWNHALQHCSNFHASHPVETGSRKKLL